MSIFSSYRLIPEEDGYTVVLFLNKNATEFSRELDTTGMNSPVTLENSVQGYLKERFPKRIVIKTVRIMIGTLLISTIHLMGETKNQAEAATPTTQTTKNTTYIVKTGDSLWRIATNNGVTVDELMAANGLSSSVIHVGQTLIIPGTGTVEPEAAPQPVMITYTVVSGDSLWGISKKYGTTVDALKTANNLTSDRLFVGQNLIIPNGSSAPPPAPNPAPTPTPAPAPTQAVSYTVKAGDTLSGIARQHNTTVDVIKRSNGLTTDLIRVGQVLTIPSTTSTPQAPSNPSENGAATAIQKQLQTLGYTAIPAMTGSYDSATVEAIKTFQNDYGLPVSGAGDSATVTALEHAVVRKGLIQDSNNYVGVPYLWGGTTPSGFDCSGFVYYMFNKHGVKMTRTTSSHLYTQGTVISKAKLQPGDLVFYAVNSPGVISHVGFYVGNNKFISATSSNGIQVVSLDNSYWSKYYVGAKRVY